MQRRLSTGRDIILVGNSYGAAVISEAVKNYENISTTAFEHNDRSPHGRIRGLIMVRLSPTLLPP
jgi:pimeloyl-ACP methyl ester carboxylesterase